MADTIHLHGLQFYAYHGADPGERELGQRFEIDLELHLDLAPAGRADDLDRTVDYRAVYSLAAAAMEPPAKLIETVAERLATAVLEHFPVDEVTVKVRKPSVPLGGVVAWAGVEIRRGRTAG